MWLRCLLLVAVINACWGHSDSDGMHKVPDFVRNRKSSMLEVEDAEFWMKSGQDTLNSKVQSSRKTGQAKNVIFFLGDGFSVPTVAATRILKGQLAGSTFGGEEAELHFETFPNLGVSKTYCSDKQVADSACSATAYLGGVKTNYGMTGVSPAVPRGNCVEQMKPENHVHSILAWAQAAGKATGVVTTTRITDASPSGNYAHIAERGWNDDQDTAGSGYTPEQCHDISRQLILNSPGNKINVILGGGREHFLRQEDTDPEYPDRKGRRQDGRNLINMWTQQKTDSGFTNEFIWNRDQLLAIDTNKTDYLLGLFASGDIAYNDSALQDRDPLLIEMTKVALEILSRNPNGFYLFVEGGLIDHGHHDGRAHRALIEALEFERAIKYADEQTSDDDTLITVTADHAHVMSISGYPPRGNPLFQFAGDSDVDGLPYTTLHYANGPGYKEPSKFGGGRYNVGQDKTEELLYHQPATVPLGSETHGGDDVLIFTKGPYGHLLNGVVEQNYIPHALAYAACWGEGMTLCNS